MLAGISAGCGECRPDPGGVTMSSMRVLTRNNVRVLGRDGDIATVVPAHGFGCEQNMWRLIVPHRTPHCRVILFDYVGAGHSDHDTWSSDRYTGLSG